ncbi:MAG: glutamate dehydrogenase [Candidatus Deianiraeaceae bacterium]|jgi:glutamate dehydrogenase
MMQKINSIVKKFHSHNGETQEFKTNLFNNFFGDINQSFAGEEHIEFVTDFCLKVVSDYKEEQIFHMVSKKRNETRASYCIVMMDRPFITDSILGWANAESLYPSIFIHPSFFFDAKTHRSSAIYVEGMQRYSIIYFELSDLLSSKQEILLNNVLKEVHIATKDYQEMKEWLLDVSRKNYQDSEVQKFIEWICDEAFVMLGTSNGDHKMGVCQLERYQGCELSNPQWIYSDVVITKSLMISYVHRRDPLDIVMIKNGDSTIYIYGIFTTHSYKNKLLEIPIVNTKINEIVKHADFQDVNYNRKELFSFLENLPREELFSTSAQFLFDVSIKYIDAMTRGKTFVYSRQSLAFPLITLAIFAPHTKFTTTLLKKVTEALQCYFNKQDITRKFSNTYSTDRVVMSFFINTQDDNKLSDVRIEELNKTLIDICENSADGLIEALSQYSDIKPNKIMQKYDDALSPGYISKHNSAEIAYDIVHIERLSDVVPCIVSVTSHNEDDVSLKVYANTQHNLHKIIHVLEQCGIITFSENPFAVSNDNISAFVHDITGVLKVTADSRLIHNKKFTDVVEKALLKQIPHTTLNKLSITAQVSHRDIFLIKSFTKYLKQIQFKYQDETIHDTLAQYPQIVRKILELFYGKFDHQLLGDRNEVIKNIDAEIKDIFSKISNITDDIILRQIYNVVKSVVRTNFFLGKEYISIKMDCAKIPNLPTPVPFREIFVYSIEFEALHLRFGKVARGGIRWSDRPNDFRTEVLGLVKAQNTKNAVIVPVGSKGGFVITSNTGNLTRDEFQKIGKECYAKFLSGCLDLCDNITKNGVETPQGIIKWEDEDPYFVVAADKGTATFSDLANSISSKYNFWLGDAFASGGSNGYDHKKMGITAKGAWIAVRRHMMELGHDVQKQDFTCIGIGDMSGDVFGNGMLLSKHIQLLASFNHMHIFIDPNPDAVQSFAERRRLFALPRSTWGDYNKEFMSNGGMIFDRSAKNLQLTPEIQEKFNIQHNEISPNELIAVLLKTKCDLLWNGGIGTYVKSSNEKHTDVGDKSNDAIRVNGVDLGCRVIGEGGNLGVTQKGRIEFAQSGGKVNTDAMDNSAGVNCSDIEVNIKIALNRLVEKSTLTIEQRNIMLEEMTPEVEALVLRNNYLQTQAITLISRDQGTKIESQEMLMRTLEMHANLDRENEFLPTSTTMHDHRVQKTYLTHPELCVLFAYSKIHLYQELLKSKLIEEKYFEQDLLTYFPKKMQEQFQGEIINHKLAREIIATSVNNSVINRIGIVFINDMITEIQCKPCDIVRAYIVVRELFDLKKIWSTIESLDFTVSYNVQMDIFCSINKAIYKCIHLLLNKHFEAIPITKMLENISPCVNTLLSYILDNQNSTGVTKQHHTITGIESSVTVNIRSTIEAMKLFALVLEVQDTKILNKNIEMYYRLANEVPLSEVTKWAGDIVVEGSLHKLAINELEDKLSTKYCKLVSRVSLLHQDTECCVETWKEGKSKQIERFNILVKDISLLEKQDFSLISMIVDNIDIL